jgi:cell division protein FtsQ
MWHNPRLLNTAAGFLVGIAVLMFAIVLAQLLLRSSLLPVREIRIGGELHQTARKDLEQAVQGRIRGNLLAVELGELRAAVEALPWVRRVSVRRVWPDRIEVELEEHRALARWGDEALVNTHGERFAARLAASRAGALPVLTGPAGTEAQVAHSYQRFAALVAPLGSELQRVVLTPRFGWQLRLASGLDIMLGRDVQAGEARLARFVRAYAQTLAPLAGRHEYVDLRYPNGFAVRVAAASG